MQMTVLQDSKKASDKGTRAASHGARVWIVSGIIKLLIFIEYSHLTSPTAKALDVLPY